MIVTKAIFQRNLLLNVSNITFAFIPSSLITHLLQPLNVGVFAPLKEAISKYLNHLIQVSVVRLEKIEMMNYIKA